MSPLSPFDSDGIQTSTWIIMSSVSGSAGGGVLVQADGKIIVGGTGGIMRFEADGSVDNSFGAGDPNQGPIAALAATADGNFVAVDISYEVAKFFGSDGSEDTSFGSSGLATGSSSGTSSAMAVSADGRIYVGGYDGSAANFLIDRFTADGTWDTSWGSSGEVTTDFGSSFEESLSLTVQADGKVVAAGLSLSGGMAVARYLVASGLNGNGLEERLYAQQDANYNVTSLTDVFGAVQERYQYDPYGKVTYMDGSWGGLMGSAKGWVYLFQGGRQDSVTGDVHFGARDMDVDQGRWKSADPLGYPDGAGRYQFAMSRPIAALDASGLSVMITFTHRFTSGHEHPVDIDQDFDNPDPLFLIKYIESIRDRGDKIKYIGFVGHAAPTCQEFNDKDDEITTGHERDGSHIYIVGPSLPDGKMIDITKILQDVLTDDATIDLKGCSSAGAPDNTAKDISQRFPNAIVKGSRASAFNFGWFVLRRSIVYRNGKPNTPPPPAHSGIHIGPVRIK